MESYGLRCALNVLNVIGVVSADPSQPDKLLTLAARPLLDRTQPYFFAGLLGMNGQRGEANREVPPGNCAHPGDADPHNDLAVVLNEQGKLDEAITEFRQAIKLNPRLVAPHLGLSDVLHTAKVRATRRSRSCPARSAKRDVECLGVPPGQSTVCARCGLP